MSKACKQSKIMVTSPTWNEFSIKKQRFFKIMIGDFDNQLRIPLKFVQRFKGQLPKKCFLKGPSKKKWMVKIEKRGDSFVFTNGWGNFVKDHELNTTDFLVFSFVGDSCFNVLIFDPSGCEKEQSYFAKKPNSFSKEARVSTLHRDKKDASEEYIFSSEEDADISMEETGPDEQDSESSSEQVIINHKGRNKGKKKNISKVEDDEFYMVESEKEEEEEGEELYHRGNEKRGCHMRQRGEACRATNSNLDLQQGSNGNSLSMSYHKAKQSQKCYISNRRNPTHEEKERAYLKAVTLSRSRPNGLPMVEITMLPTHVYTGFHLTIPNEWALEHMLREDHEVELRLPNEKRKWTVGCRWTPSQCQIRAKWPTFVHDNNLEKDDICVFELVHKGKLNGNKTSVMRVHIFRAVPGEIVPLTKSTRMV